MHATGLTRPRPAAGAPTRASCSRVPSFLLRVCVRPRSIRHIARPTNMSFHRATAVRSTVRVTWDSERVEELKRHFNAGLTCSQIAREIGVTRNAVIGKMNRLGLSRPKDVITAQQEH